LPVRAWQEAVDLPSHQDVWLQQWVAEAVSVSVGLANLVENAPAPTGSREVVHVLREGREVPERPSDRMPM
jgi:hypothetical protein